MTAPATLTLAKCCPCCGQPAESWITDEEYRLVCDHCLYEERADVISDEAASDASR